MIWIHAASAGEGNQARPLAELLSEKYDAKVVLTVFSPSGYSFHKNSTSFSRVAALPLDLPANVFAFISHLDPLFAIFIRNELWKNYLDELKSRNIPVFLVNTPDHVLWPRNFLMRPYIRKCLSAFTGIFPSHSSDNIKMKTPGGLPILPVHGDTKWDAARQSPAEDAVLRDFTRKSLCILAGSTWKKDEEFLQKWWRADRGITTGNDIRIIIAPHLLSAENIARLKAAFPDHCLYSQYNSADTKKKVMILDRYGLLQTAYSHAGIAIIGGGFGRGIHNIAEAAIHGIPTLFGPNHKKFGEARMLIEGGGAFCFRNYMEFSAIMDKLAGSADLRQEIRSNIKRITDDQSGASVRIVDEIMRIIPPDTSGR